MSKIRNARWERDTGQRRAVTERLRVDTGHAFGDNDIGQCRAAKECSIVNSCDRTWDGDAGYLGAVHKGIVTDIFHGMFDSIIDERSRNRDIAAISEIGRTKQSHIRPRYRLELETEASRLEFLSESGEKRT